MNTPKSWWHNCKHKIESSKVIGKSLSEKTVDCDFCDHDLSAFTVHSYDFFQIQKSVVSVFKDILFEGVSIPSFDLIALRGPPSLTI